MIADFADSDTERLFLGEKPKKLKIPSELWKVTQRKLLQLNEAMAVTDLYIPPSNHFEALSGEYKGYYSIRINNRWRIVFQFIENHAYQVKVTDHYRR